MPASKCLLIFNSKGVSPSLNELLPLFQFPIILPLVEKPTLLILIILLLSDDHQSLRYLIHIDFCWPDELQDNIIFLIPILLCIQVHRRFQHEGIETVAELEVLLEKAFFEETAVEEHL